MTDVVYLSKEESAAADGDFDNDAEYDDEYDDTYDDNAVGQEEPGVQFKGHLELRVLICDKYMDIRNRALQVQNFKHDLQQVLGQIVGQKEMY